VIWDVDPILFDLGSGLPKIRWYGACFATGIIVTATMFGRYADRRKLPNEPSLSLSMLAGIVLGAHLGHLLFYEPSAFLENPWRILQLGYGLASHGGVIGVVLAIIIWARRKGQRVHGYLDCAGLSAAFLIPFVRLGNFFNSEIVGRYTTNPDSWWGVVFLRRGENIPRHPAQLYEMAVGFGLIGLAFWLDRRRDRLGAGTAFYAIVLIYFVARFGIEFVKEYQVLTAGLTMGHWLSIPIIAFCGLGLRWSLRQPPSEPYGA